ncbi:MAG: M23 family metallopeptidase [Bacteroidetes bacterium]|nr:M23 family metallopeptidase [Bacteroidota bacterium]
MYRDSMKRSVLRYTVAALLSIVTAVVLFHALGRTPARASSPAVLPLPPLAVIADSLRSVSSALDNRIRLLRHEDASLGARIAMPVLSSALSANARLFVEPNGNELPVTPRSDAFELNNRIERQQSYIDALNTAIERHREMLNALPTLTPCNGVFTSGFGVRVHPISGVEKMHTGVDIAAPRGRPIHASGDGVVSFAGVRHGYGNVVEIDHGYGYHTLYGHASALLVNVGDTVRRGDPIALVGSTGASTGPHCHYEVMVDDTRVDPAPFLLVAPVADPETLAPQHATSNAAKGRHAHGKGTSRSGRHHRRR